MHEAFCPWQSASTPLMRGGHLYPSDFASDRFSFTLLLALCSERRKGEQMLVGLVVLQLVLLLLVALLVLRKPVSAPAPASTPAIDERLLRLPDAVVALAARADATDNTLRAGIDSLRRQGIDDAERSRTAMDLASRGLRDEVANNIAALGRVLHDGLHGLRTDNTVAADQLRSAVHANLQGLAASLDGFFQASSKTGLDAQEMLHTRLTELGSKNTQGHEALRSALQNKLHDLSQDQHGHQERLRLSLQQNLEKLNADNVTKLEEMRHTVDEKLQATLHTRLTESFGQVTTHLGDVQKGLGEMKELATGVSDLKKVFSNVKARGIVGEFQLGMQLEQMFSPDQYVRNARIKPGSQESVEFALKIPDGDRDHVLLPIDAKFPREDWERLEHAYEHGTPEEQARAGREFESAIRTEGKRICSKYIDPPTTLPFAVMFLPTEALYAEVMRRPALHTDLQSSCNVTIAGPSSFMAILTSFQMGFRTLAIQKKGSEVWKILGGVKTEFGKFETLMTKVESNVTTVQRTLGDIGVRTRAINRNLRGVSELPAADPSPLTAFEEIAHVAPLLAAQADD